MAMQNLIIEASERTPKIQILFDQGTIEVAGESYPEDVATFYGPVIDAVQQLTQSTETVKASFALIYVNSSSMKALYRLFELLNKKKLDGGEVSILWKFESDDDVMQELGEDFQDRFPQLKFELTEG